MKPAPPEKLSFRERQLMDILYALGEGTAAQVMENMDDPPGFSTVRKWLFLMEGKGLIRHRKSGRQFFYKPVVPREHALKRMFERLADVFFQGSRIEAAAALLLDADPDLDPEEIERVQALIEKKRDD